MDLKKECRKKGIESRRSLSQEERQRFSQAIRDRIKVSPCFMRSKTILIYRATADEVDLVPLLFDPECADKIFCFPKVTSKTDMTVLAPHPDSDWIPGSFSILEPNPSQSDKIDPDGIDLVLCPCTAFDSSCSRIGMGGGYYDRYLQKCKTAVYAAVAFEVQKADTVPASPHDVRMNYVFTEKETYRSCSG